MNTSILWLVFWLLTKHLVVDFLLQGPYMYKNKGTYGHFGGILHAWVHQTATLLILFYYLPVMCALELSLIEGFLHYHIDWAKMNICRVKKWKANTSEWFWYMLGIDQYLHSLCYLGIVVFVFYTNLLLHMQ